MVNINASALHPQTKSKKHFRSASCDVKMIRSFAKDHNSASADACESSKFRNLKKLQTHSRNNSSDLNTDFRHKLVAQSNSCSRDDPIRYIQNQLKPHEDEEEEDELTAGCGHFVKKHSRNHSYDQIYLPNNIRFDPEFFRGHHYHKKNVNLLKNVAAEAKLKNSNECSESVVAALPSRSHSRNNSKDLNCSQNSSTAITPSTDPISLSILRHRRTNSKDLNIIVNHSNEHPLPSSSIPAVAAVHPIACSSKHSRNSSNQKIQIDDDRSGLIDNNPDDDEEIINL